MEAPPATSQVIIKPHDKLCEQHITQPALLIVVGDLPHGLGLAGWREQHTVELFVRAHWGDSAKRQHVCLPRSFLIRDVVVVVFLTAGRMDGWIEV